MKNSVAETTEQTTICKHTRIISLYNQNPLESSFHPFSVEFNTNTLTNWGLLKECSFYCVPNVLQIKNCKTSTMDG